MSIQACLRLLGEILDGGAAQRDLIAFVRSSLGLSEDETQSVCWEYPRSLMLEAVPTAYRRVSSGWSAVQLRDVIPGRDIIARQPLPEFIPSTLFSDLALPEVEVSRRPDDPRPIPLSRPEWPSTNSPRVR